MKNLITSILMVSCCIFSIAQISTHDKLGRVETEKYQDGTEILYTWDKVGNLINIQVLKTSTLPVELLVFTAEPYDKVESNQSLLEWTTATEINNDKFEVEWSSDGENFAKVGEVAGAGNSSAISAYNFVHKEPIIGLNYYRLKQQDFDGKFEYSEIRVVEFIEIFVSDIILFPNPASSLVTLKVNSHLGGQNVSVFDLTGKLVSVKVTSLSKNVWQIDISSLVVGSYFVSVKIGEEIISKQLVVN